MKKTILLFTLIFALILLCACSAGQPSSEPTPSESTENTDVQEPTTPTQLEETETNDAVVTESEETAPAEVESTAEPNVVIDGNTIALKDDGTGTASSENDMEKTPVLTTRDINYEADSGPVHMVVESLQVSKLTVTSDEVASMLDWEKDVEGVLIGIQATVENTSADDVSFYPYMSTIITNTKIQADSNWLFSDDVGGDFFGNVQKSGQIYWLIPNANAEEITHLQWRIDAPCDTNLDKLGEDLQIEIELNK